MDFSLEFSGRQFSHPVRCSHSCQHQSYCSTGLQWAGIQDLGILSVLSESALHDVLS